MNRDSEGNACDREILYNNFLPDDLKLWKPMANPQAINIVKDYRTLENQQDPGQVGIRQNINTRHVRLESNSEKDLLIGINIYRDYKLRPKPQFMLRGGEARDLAINMPGERQQFLWIYSPITGKVIADPHPMRWGTNQFVIIEGENRFWTIEFRSNGYRGQI